MSRKEGNPRSAKPGNAPAAADDPTLDPDATRIVPAGAPLDRMPPNTAANRAAPAPEPLPEPPPEADKEPPHDDGPETVQHEREISFIDPTFPDTFSMRAGRKPADIPVDTDHTVIAPAALLTPRPPAESAVPAVPAVPVIPAEASSVTPSPTPSAPAPSMTPPAAPVEPPAAPPKSLAELSATGNETVIVPASALPPSTRPAPSAVVATPAAPATPAASLPPAAATGNETVIAPAAKPVVAKQPAVEAAQPPVEPPAPAVAPPAPVAAPVAVPVASAPRAAPPVADEEESEFGASEFAETVFDPDAAAAMAALRAMPPEPERRPSTGTLPGGTLAAKVASNDAPVRQVGRFQVLDRIGRGGMASVFKAHDPSIGRDVAIKFLHASLCEDEEYHARFLREARASGSLSHPNIVTVHDVGEVDGRPYMAMELLDGDPLADLLEPGTPLPIRDTVVMAIQLARALDYAHKRGIVHRDIKPGNIARVRGTLDIKVMDFGIAHMESTKGEQRTRVGDVLGTPQYMAPEQMNGEKIDGRSDLFSVGIVLYQMLTGVRPFTGDSVVNLALKIAKDDPTPLNKLRPEIPASLRRVVDRCMAKAPDNRFQTGAELADALVKVLTEIDEEARNKGRAKLIPLRVKWAAMMAGIVAIVMAVSGSIISQRQNAALMQQVADYGTALSRFIAAQNATAALGEDWVSVDVSLQEIMKTGDFESVSVIDRAGVVAASSLPDTVGKPYQAPPGETLGEQGVVKRTRYHAAGGAAILGFDSPITFQDKTVGRVALGLPERPLESVARLSRTLMAVLAVTTVLAVAIAMFFVANWFSRPIKLVVEALDEIGRGRVDFRIREQRKDEFGLLYAAFDRMAQALQDKQALAASAAKAEAPTTIGRKSGALAAARKQAAEAAQASSAEPKAPVAAAPSDEQTQPAPPVPPSTPGAA
ncbi:protein kinase domain-containing protein [Mitsuaria sp. 7]|uniref:protein kinase domain-containing protein n=1 Tax=Mitsuaria sp. 7 TaxID=1658665 RepID=UPI00082A32F8|nr:protein kinase [Mitsuaria sp. 7]